MVSILICFVRNELQEAFRARDDIVMVLETGNFVQISA